MQRLGGFLNDELKIANLIIYFFVPIFTYFHQNFFESRNKKILILILIIAVYIAIFLTGERSNFLTFNIFIFLYFLSTNLRKLFILFYYFIFIIINIF